MTPTSFEFSVSMPRDARLVGAVRGLAAHAAGYVQLAAGAAEGLANQVAQATETAIAAGNQPGPIDVRFAGDAAAISITITCPAAAASPAPPSTTADGGITVEWTTNGSHHTCEIRQRIPS
jgi:plastocyanin